MVPLVLWVVGQLSALGKITYTYIYCNMIRCLFFIVIFWVRGGDPATNMFHGFLSVSIWFKKNLSNSAGLFPEEKHIPNRNGCSGRPLWRLMAT